MGKKVVRVSKMGYDVLVFVGLALFQRYRTTQEVLMELLARKVRLSASEVTYLGRKFISFLALGHRLATLISTRKCGWPVVSCSISMPPTIARRRR